MPRPYTISFSRRGEQCVKKDMVYRFFLENDRNARIHLHQRGQSQSFCLRSFQKETGFTLRLKMFGVNVNGQHIQFHQPYFKRSQPPGLAASPRYTIFAQQDIWQPKSPESLFETGFYVCRPSGRKRIGTQAEARMVIDDGKRIAAFPYFPWRSVP